MKNNPKYLIIHHLGGTNDNPLLDTSNHTFEVVDAYHKSLGWGGCGYHYVIEKKGKVVQGRKEDAIGAHTIGYNDKSLGIALCGNFDRTMPTYEQIEALRTLVTTLKEKYNISIDNIVPHRKFANKSCFGNNLTNDWIKQIMSNTPKPVESCTSEKATIEVQKKQIINLQTFINSLLSLFKTK